MKKVFNTIVGFTALIAIWQLAVLLGGYNKALFPAPVDVAKAFIELMNKGTLWTHIQHSMSRFAIGYLISIVAGVLLGLILGWSKKLWAFVNPIVQVLRPISPIAWLPFVVLWFGIGDIPAIVIIFIASFFPILLSTITAVNQIDSTYLKVADNFGIKQPYILFKIVVPAIFPKIMTGIHLALGSAWVFLVAGEMVGAQSGLGYLIIDSRNNLRLDMLMSAMLMIGLIGLLLDTFIRFVEKVIFKRWAI
jgi:NitT/TauT family transport system permease protein